MASGSSPGDSKTKRKLVNLVDITQDGPEVPAAMPGSSRSPSETGGLGQVMMMMAELNERMASMEAMRATAAHEAAGQNSGRKRKIHEVSSSESEDDESPDEEESDHDEDPLRNLGK